MTLLAENPALWDRVFVEPKDRLAFIRRSLRGVRGEVLDVGCATGNLCRALRKGGTRIVGLDVNRAFIDAAATKDPDGVYVVGDMRALRLRRRFDLIFCLGTTLSYARTNDEVLSTLKGFRRHLNPGGKLVIDVLNAAALLSPLPFRRETRHAFTIDGERITATIAHRLRLKEQLLTEQVTWRGRTGGRSWSRRDPEDALRLFFPQELVLMLSVAGLPQVTLRDGYVRPSRLFSGRRLVAVAQTAQTSLGVES